MKRHLQVLLAGALVVVPFAITLYVIWSAAGWLGGMGTSLLDKTRALETLERIFPRGWVYSEKLDPAGRKIVEIGWFIHVVGAVVVLAAIYFVGLLTHLWVFRKLLSVIERWISRVPGVKTIYESVRDLMKLFGADSSRMGRAVFYKVPQTEISVLGILTNEHPAGVSPDGRKRVAVYLPFSYMFGGPTIYVTPENVVDAGISVDQALKLCATAHVTPQPIPELPRKGKSRKADRSGELAPGEDES